MSKPYSSDDLINYIADDRTWRIRELSDLRAIIEREDDKARRVLLRALVGLCYAHWEGYVKNIAKAYLYHVSLRKHKFSQLDRQYLRNYFLPRLDALSNSRVSLQEKCKLIDKILDSSIEEFRRVNEDLVYTENLKFAVLLDICKVCGVDEQSFIEKMDFIDIFLLKRRNSIAHGEDTFVHLEDMPKLIGETIEMMRIFGNALENNAVLKSYLAPTEPAAKVV